MISIKDIYQWYHNPPTPPSGLTPLQDYEWREQNSKAINDYRNKSFVKELLKGSALIEIISINKINAIAIYRGKHFYSSFDQNILKVKYEIFYDESLYETVKLIYNNSIVEFEGEILKLSIEFKSEFEWQLYKSDYYDNVEYYHIQLNLSKIKVIEKLSLSAELLDDKFKPKTLPPPSKSSQCFIATATFGNQDKTEVIQLREFRDKILINSIGGRIFITTYCILSPPIAFIIKQSKWLCKLTRSFLRKVVLPLTKRRLQGYKKLPLTML